MTMERVGVGMRAGSGIRAESVACLCRGGFMGERFCKVCRDGIQSSAFAVPPAPTLRQAGRPPGFSGFNKFTCPTRLCRAAAGGGMGWACGHCLRWATNALAALYELSASVLSMMQLLWTMSFLRLADALNSAQNDCCLIWSPVSAV